MNRKLVWVVLVFAQAAWAQEVNIPNRSFEDAPSGADAAARPVPGWTLEGGTAGGRVAQGAADGQAALWIEGDGKGSGAWRSEAVSLKPTTLYCLTVKVRGGGSGGTGVRGFGFCNIDLGKAPAVWREMEDYFVSPRQIVPDQARLRLGQWEVKGRVEFDDVHVHEAQAVHARQGELVLGEGEAIEGDRYTFYAPLDGPGRNFSRPLHDHGCFFNSTRWCLHAGADVVYRHVLAGRKQSAAQLELGICYYAGGVLIAEASADGKAWAEIGRLDAQKAGTFAIPASMLPAAEVWVRLRAQPKDGQGGCSIQISDYGYSARLDGPPVRMVGRTQFFRVLAADPRTKVRIESMGGALPGNHTLLAACDGPVASFASGVVPLGQRPQPRAGADVHMGPGPGRLAVPYSVPSSGEWALVVAVDGFEAVTTIRVAQLHESSFGQLLPGGGEAAAVWWASSGWKISRLRPPPQARGEAVVIRTARNEAEAAQVVVRPAGALKGLTAKAGPLAGPAGAVLPASCVQVLGVKYLHVARPTDSTGTVGDWPDPLPPLDKPLDVEAGTNQPLWVRVTAPRDAAAGVYTGRIELSAEGWAASVPLRVEVFGFTLPDRMTCQTSFGFSAQTVWDYQNVKDPAQRREVLAKYLASFASHRISPYDPAPMDHFRVHWPKVATQWEGGRLDRTQKHAGESSLLVVDENPRAAVSACTAQKVAIPPKGLTLRAWHHAPAGHTFMIALNHHDADGKWMPGRNNTMTVTGTGGWAEFVREQTRFPEGARSVTVSLWPAAWSEAGEATGKVWFDDVSLREPGGGGELLAGGSFEPPPLDSLKPTIEWDAWDAAMKVAMEQYHFNAFTVPIQGMGGGTFHARYEPGLLGYGEGTPEYQALFTSYCSQVQEHLRQKGWLDRSYVYWFDEPDPKDYEFVMKGFARLRAACPDIPRMLTEQVEDALVGGPNLWCPVSPDYNHERAEQRRRAGERFWWYVCCGPKGPYCTLFLDHPSVELRCWLWQTWQRKIEGILVWETVWWHSPTAYPAPARQNPYDDPMSWCSGYGIPIGTKSPWGNGDGRFLYPPLAAAGGRPAQPVLDGPVESIRWEMLRDGVEDYEYLAMLRRLLDKHRPRLPVDGRQAMEELLTVPADITADMTHFSRSPAPIEARRERLARAIAALVELEPAASGK